MKREEVIRLFPERIRKILQQAYWNPQGLQEIRLRAGKPLILWQDGQEYFVAEQGFLTRHREQACIVSQEDIRGTMETVGTYSLYAYEEELKQGFFDDTGRASGWCGWKSDHGRAEGKRTFPDFLHQYPVRTPDYRLCGYGDSVCDGRWKIVSYTHYFPTGLWENNIAAGSGTTDF